MNELCDYTSSILYTADFKVQNCSFHLYLGLNIARKQFCQKYRMCACLCRYAKVWGARGTAAAGSVLPPCRAVGAAILCCFLNGPWLRSYWHRQGEINEQKQAQLVICKGKWTYTEVIWMFFSWVSSLKVQSSQSEYKTPLCQWEGPLMQ